MDTITFLLFNITAGVTFLIAALIAVYGILKFLGCLRPCYNCKKCTYGLGRLSALYFGNRTLKDYKETYGLTIAIFFYTLIGPFPAVLALFSVVQTFAIPELAIMIILLILSIYSALTWKAANQHYSN